MQKKIERINSIIQEELGQIILKDVELPQGHLTTITRVECSEDLTSAKVYVSVLPDSGMKRVLYVLGKVVYPLQKLLNKRLRMKPVPKIRFVEEHATIEAARVEELLRKIKEKS